MESSENPMSIDVWGRGFRTGGSGGMFCDICSALVRQSPGDAKRHLEWHAKHGD